jgi:hypothetical protein
MTLNEIGLFFYLKCWKRAKEVGTQTAARQLRKQGIPINVALAIFAPRIQHYQTEVTDSVRKQ